MTRPFFLISTLLCVIAAAQEPRPRVPAAAAASPVAGEHSAPAAGIAERPIRALIVHQDGYEPSVLQGIENATRALLDRIASGSKLTKADAARSAGSGTVQVRSLEDAIARWMAADRQVGVVAVHASPQSAGFKPIKCPPEDCGCKPGQVGGNSCDCGLMGGWCFCTLCYDPPRPLTTFPEEEITLSSIHIKGGRMAAPRVRPFYIVFTVAPPSAPREAFQRMATYGLQVLRSESWPAARLTIKTKSSPP